MLAELDRIEQRIAMSGTVPDGIDAAFGLVDAVGFDAVIYDYSPVATSPGGDLLTPTHLSQRNVPGDMRRMWCEQGYHQRDPVQQLALGRSMPFAWSYRRNDKDTDLAAHLSEEHAPVSAYLHDAGLTCGVTVPLHRVNGGFATFTVLRRNAPRNFARTARHHLSEIGMIGQILHEHSYALFDETERQYNRINLTERERECLRFSAEGLTAKETARRIKRSVPTVTLHLNSAIRKLNARNRVHAVTLANHYRLLDL